MFGSIFYNFWAALLSFAVYFIAGIQNPYAMPLPTIGAALVISVIAFSLMFLIRYFLGYVFYTPEAPVLSQTEEELPVVAKETDKTQIVSQSDHTTMEVEDENTEEIAQVVRSMLQSDESLTR
ncbi:multidrug transporter [Solibacillus isronensis]|uniref:multidrug transporter n=1 Tax=Solibacillus isronensis TaxID=412383 RepID=UPI00203CADA9|nr:multidrug transporter [Solibacillus isronensis]MCM3722171.1 multidrug transporter [Solibacillus isronensis]